MQNHFENLNVFACHKKGYIPISAAVCVINIALDIHDLPFCSLLFRLQEGTLYCKKSKFLICKNAPYVSLPCVSQNMDEIICIYGVNDYTSTLYEE